MMRVVEINDNLISVLDTSDKSVDIVTKNDAIHCIRDLNIPIFGVVHHRDDSYSFHTAHELYEKSRTKLHLHMDFELCCSSDDTLLYCKCDSVPTQSFSILLEDYVSGCMGEAFRNFCQQVNPDIKITFIFTDNLKLDPYVLGDFQVNNATYDLVQLSDATASQIYQVLIKQGTVFDTEQLVNSLCIRDMKVRFYYYKLLYYGYKLRDSQDGKFDALLNHESLACCRKIWINRMIEEHRGAWDSIIGAALSWYGEPTYLEGVSYSIAERKLHKLCLSRFSSKYLNLLYSLMCLGLAPRSVMHTICRIDIDSRSSKRW